MFENKKLLKQIEADQNKIERLENEIKKLDAVYQNGKQKSEEDAEDLKTYEQAAKTLGAWLASVFEVIEVETQFLLVDLGFAVRIEPKSFRPLKFPSMVLHVYSDRESHSYGLTRAIAIPKLENPLLQDLFMRVLREEFDAGTTQRVFEDPCGGLEILAYGNDAVNKTVSAYQRAEKWYNDIITQAKKEKEGE